MHNITQSHAVERFGSGSSYTHALLRTEQALSPVVLRVMLGLVMFPHGAQKLLGWFGGPGFAGEMAYFTQDLGIPYAFGVLAIIAEIFGSMALIAGFLTRIAAFGIGCTMVVAALLVHLPYGFFMDWFGTQGGEGFEYHLLVLGMAIALIMTGGGAFSVDRRLAENRAKSFSG